MPNLTVRTGHDTFVLEAAGANHRNARARYLQIRSGDELIPLIFLPVNATRISGKTIVSASLSIAVDADWVNQNVTIQALDADWKAGRVTYNNMPGVTGPTASSGATGALSAGDRFEIDVTDLIQKIADGDPNYGWRLTTSQSSTASLIRSFESGKSSFVLTAEFVDRPDAPTQLSPEGVIGVSKPVLTIEDYGTMLSQIQVQIDATPAPSNADYDTGWVSASSIARPKVDMSDTFPLGTAGGVADTTYNGLSNGDSTYWRARVKLTNGGESEWSSWAEITRVNKPSIVDDSGTTFYDPTPVMEAHLSPAGDADTRWQVIITDVSDPSSVRYNSGDAIDGATLSLEIPLRNGKGRKIFVDDVTYRREIRAWDRTDRVPSQGDKPYVSLVDNITINSDGALDEPTLSVSMVEDADGYPQPRLHVEALAEPEWFVVRRDGEFLATFDAPTYEVGLLEWEWDDDSATPNVEHTYAVRSGTTISGARRNSPNSNPQTVMATVESVWLRSDVGNVELFGDSIDAVQVDKRQAFDRPYSSEAMDIVTAVGGLEGTAALTIDRRCADLEATRAVLDELRNAPNTAVQLIWGTHSVWVNLRGLSVVWAPSSIVPLLPAYDVKFGFFEIVPVD